MSPVPVTQLQTGRIKSCGAIYGLVKALPSQWRLEFVESSDTHGLLARPVRLPPFPTHFEWDEI